MPATCQVSLMLNAYFRRESPVARFQRQSKAKYPSGTGTPLPVISGPLGRYPQGELGNGSEELACGVPGPDSGFLGLSGNYSL